MFPAGLHALGRNRPELPIEVDLGPDREPDLARTRCRQDQGFEGKPPDAFAFAQSADEGGNLRIGQSAVMRGLRPHLGQRFVHRRDRQRHGAIALGDCPIDHHDDSLANAPGGFWLVEPDGNQRIADMGAFDVAHCQVAKMREGIGRKRR